MQQKIQQIFLDFEIFTFELVALVIAFPEREYLSSGVNILTNKLKISDIAKTELFELIFLLNDQNNTTKIPPGITKQCFGPFEHVDCP